MNSTVFFESPDIKQKVMTDEQGTLPTVNFAQCLLTAGKKQIVHQTGQEPKFLDPLLYIFTSGTTGVPKAVRCTHGR